MIWGELAGRVAPPTAPLLSDRGVEPIVEADGIWAWGMLTGGAAFPSASITVIRQTVPDEPPATFRVFTGIDNLRTFNDSSQHRTFGQ